ncbi:hypothetical protein HPB49_003787 [Dermacentor silvarum]|uniref:Uncharacterized protein n=1 Tax=Dermacentor silvarum TaxID=543639 RepID=A0ACB8DTX8_DERSI|nr:hypothetical protein HPB49_003787 [Dermacentor silvarum]
MRPTYYRDTRKRRPIKGILLERTATALGLRAINQIGKPTRTGNSVSRDTAPDRAFTINVREVILYTNLAETSITVVDVVYVVDTGLHREQRINPSTGVSLLGTFPTSTASVQQRGGRAGRVRPGESHHLFTQDEFLSWDQFKHPEIQTIDLTRVVLDCKPTPSTPLVDSIEVIEVIHFWFLEQLAMP